MAWYNTYITKEVSVYRTYLGLSLKKFQGQPRGCLLYTSQAQGLTPYTEFETTWTQGWFQACVWLALGGNLPDYETDPTGWVEAVATERMRVVNAYHDAGYEWATHYENIDDGSWTCRQAAQYILNHPDWWGDWKIYSYQYNDKGSGSHPDPSKIQSIIVGIYNPCLLYTSMERVLWTFWSNDRCKQKPSGCRCSKGRQRLLLFLPSIH